MHVYSELISAQLENKGSDPSPGTKGRIYHKSTTEPIKIDDGTTIHKVLTDQMYSDISSHITPTPTPMPIRTLMKTEFGVTHSDFVSPTINGINWQPNSPYLLHLDSADFPTITGKAQKLRLKVQYYGNNLAPGASFVFGIYPVVSTSGTFGTLGIDIGTVVTGSTVTLSTPAANSILAQVSSNIDLPANGHFVLGYTISGSMNGQFYAQCSASVQHLYV